MSTPTLDPRLVALHDGYVAAINHAVAADDLTLAEELAAQFDRDALALTRAA